MSDELTLNNLLSLPWEARFVPANHEEDLFRYDSWWIAHSQGAEDSNILSPLFQQVTELVDDTPETVEARARLWAAAPELLKACVAALIQLGASDSDDVERLQAVYDTLYKATYKATGRDIPLEEWGETFPIPWHCSDCGAAWEASLAEFPDQAHCPKCQSVHIY